MEDKNKYIDYTKIYPEQIDSSRNIQSTDKNIPPMNENEMRSPSTLKLTKVWCCLWNSDKSDLKWNY